MQTLINCVFDLFKILLILEVIRFLCFKLFGRSYILRFFFSRSRDNKFYFKRRLKQYLKLAKNIKLTLNRLVVNIICKNTLIEESEAIENTEDEIQDEVYQQLVNNNNVICYELYKKVMNDENLIYYKTNSKLRHKWNK